MFDKVQIHVHGLTPRQQEIFNLMADGKSVMDIAQQLNISDGTVKIHVGHINNIFDGCVSGLGSLTDRQKQIADLYADGKSAREIASELRISSRTVETHILNVYRTLGINKNVGLIRLMHGLSARATDSPELNA
ncbi:MAG: helix-turn-helix transcriptional regulator [Micavibrio sp.]|nr:helix-turn-helix transcriptional regulator [Micavibrio sp.]